MDTEGEETNPGNGTYASRNRLFEHGPTVMYAAQPADPLRILFMSGNVESHFGYRPEEVVGETGFLSSAIHPDDRPGVAQGADALGDAGSLTQTYRIRHKDGTYRWVRDEMVLVDGGNGEETEILGYLADITPQKESEEALKESEQQFRRSFNSSTIGMTIVELGGHFQRVNPAFCRFLGYSEKELLKKTIQDITHPGDRGWPPLSGPG
jgi:PAS domain S-box-containing protein